MTFTFREVSDEKTLKQIYRFRCEILCNEQSVFDINNYPEKEESDQYDPYSIHFAGFDEEGEVASYCRFILGSPVGYPTENGLKFDCDNSLFKRDKVGELSRIYINKKYRSLRTSKILFEPIKEFMSQKMYENKIEYTFGALEKKFIRLLKMNKIKYEPIGKAQDYLGFMRFPCIIYTNEFLNDNPELKIKILE